MISLLPRVICDAVFIQSVFLRSIFCVKSATIQYRCLRHHVWYLCDTMICPWYTSDTYDMPMMKTGSDNTWWRSSWLEGTSDTYDIPMVKLWIVWYTSDTHDTHDRRYHWYTSDTYDMPMMKTGSDSIWWRSSWLEGTSDTQSFLILHTSSTTDSPPPTWKSNLVGRELVSDMKLHS